MKTLRKLSIFGWLIISVGVVAAQQTRDLTAYVNPFIGTGGHGHTFPGATMPHGAVQLSPDTRGADWDGSSGYHYSDSIIYGFSQTHLSGIGIPDYCDILFAPYISKEDFWQAKQGDETMKGYASRFSHQNEKAEAGYYSVKLDDENIIAEMTATTRAGFERYTFPEATDNAKITLDLAWRDKVLDSEIKVVGNNQVEGYRRSESWAKNQIVYFVAEFSKPFESSKIYLDDEGKLAPSPQFSGKNIKTVFRFTVRKGEQILVKVGISAVDIEGARKNLQTEIPDWNFDKVRQDAKNAWQKELSSIEVSGGTNEQLTNFYTALYHTKIAPNVFQDVDGRYLGDDKQIHTAKDFTNYTVFSLWDTFRAAHPLYTIIDQKRSRDFINTFIKQYEQGGRLPVWELAANETDCMIGYHAVSVIADAMAKDIKGFDYEKAFEAAKHSSELNHFGLEAYKRRGYISSEDEQESVSKTLEYAYDNYCIAQMAKILWKRREVEINKTGFETSWNQKDIESEKTDYQHFIQRAQYFENLFDAETGFMRPKQNGGFIAPFAPNEVTFNFTEGNSWVYSFFAPHDISRLIELQGGREKFAQKLDALFTTTDKLAGREQPDITGLIGQYAHGNEPSHHIGYLYNYAGEPWKTQKIIRRILDEFYKPQPDGLIGNEDCGQMSAWYVLSALGFYEVNPSNPVYDLGTPLFKEARIHLENGKTFTIRSVNVSDKNIYLKSVKLGGKDLKQTYFSHSQLMNGGVLEFEMADTPVTDWFTDFSVSKTGTDSSIVPTIDATRVFSKETTVKIASLDKNAKIFYTLDGSEPTPSSLVYIRPLNLTESSTVKAVSVNASGEKSFTVEAKLNKMPHDWTVKILSKYNRQYTGGGDEGLIDGIRGTTNFSAGAWQGYQAQDFIAVIDLQRETEIKKLGGGFLQNARSWIWMPTRVEFETSNDGVNFTKAGEIKTDIAVTEMTEQTRDYQIKIPTIKARFVRVTAKNLGKIPAWHPGVGEDAFIFVDEIIVE